MEEINPLVTVNILSFNRKDELRNTLQKVYAQNYKNIEVIVVDNNSTDGSTEMVDSEFPLVKLIKLKKNIGIAGWNEGFKIAKGKYVLVLDDDSYPDKNTIEEGIKYLKKDDKIGIIAFNIFNNRIKKSETEEFKNPPYFFVGCGALVSKKLIDKIGFFNETYFLYYHELDYSARCYDYGFKILYLSNIIVFHEQSLTARTLGDPFLSPKRFYFYFISYSIFLIQNFYLRYIFFYLLKWFLNRLIVCIKEGFYSEYFKSIFKIVRDLKLILKKRKVLSLEIQKFYKFGNVPLIDREYFPNFKKPSFNFASFRERTE